MSQRRFDKAQMQTRALAARLAKIKDDPVFTRAGGDVICSLCGFDYYSHPHHPVCLYLTVLCDGSVMKL